MIYQEFVRVNKIDTQITELHNELTRLYIERAQLLGTNSISVAPDKTQTNTVTFETSLSVPESRGDTFFVSLYEHTVKDWKKYGVKVPRYKQLQARLEQAERLIQAFAREDANLLGHMHIRVVPPQKTLRKAIETPEAKKFCDETTSMFLADYQGCEKWRVLVVFDISRQQRIVDFEAFLEDNSETIKQSNTMHLGVQECVAIHLQNLTLVREKSWLILLANQLDETTAPCVKLKNGKLHFSIDDSAGILGDNYFNPAVAVE